MDRALLLSELTPDDIKSPFNKWAEAIGIDNLYKLCKSCTGIKQRIPNQEVFLRILIKRLVIEDYKTNNYTMLELAEKYNISKGTVFYYIHGARKQIRKA